MDFYDYIYSKDIAEYLSNNSYEFTALEASWIIYQSISKTIDGKIIAWEWIINNMPDEEVIARRCCDYRPSLHDCLGILPE